ncbi:Chromodomain helicase DNA binding protein 1 like [Paragonimus heterotremus]|uniref:Chromodomain helicase DNA binding protein 1 like n=1 Tax=Paragonimus heterotremus TaxID=100268 RepID=A0A8J4T3T2_9TREM|nr:Chromodomain helicase DNA binding protein 1 like [Paragonimus heterotremus]
MEELLRHTLTARSTDTDVIHQADLENCGIRNVKLRDYQLCGVSWLNVCASQHRGGILCDEMGLGKTCQIVAFLAVMLQRKSLTSILLVCPLSVLETWIDELKRFFPSVSFLVYAGNQDQRVTKRAEYDPKSYPILLTTYELCINDQEFIASFNWEVLIVDEGHRLKNAESVLYDVLLQVCRKSRFLLTGTPIQNNLMELYNLLHFVAPTYFAKKGRSAFVNYFNSQDCSDLATRDAQLATVLHPFLLRRTKHQVLLDLPPRIDLIIYHSLAPLQKKIYRALLTRNIDVFSAVVDEERGTTRSKLPANRINNLLMQLRKCVGHPYLFDGLEPEPFELGPHIVDTSGKLTLLDLLLKFLYNPFAKTQTAVDLLIGPVHKVLIFSQMTRMLDIVQDYLTLMDYNYERLDGSVRGDDRFAAIRGFNQTQESFVFLLSTRAGGQGLNLVAADTVILLDGDFNPQNDLQATARVHRIGQTKPVRVIRLVGRDTVEEAILSRADAKLKLSTRILGTTCSSPEDPGAVEDLGAVLKFGLSRLLDQEESKIGASDCTLKPDLDFTQILGETDVKTWHWLPPRANSFSDHLSDWVVLTDSAYKCELTDEDLKVVEKFKKAHEELVEKERNQLLREGYQTRAQGTIPSVKLNGVDPTSSARLKPQPTAQLAERKVNSAEATEARRQKNLETAKQRAAAKLEKRMAWWKSVGYSSWSVFREESPTDVNPNSSLEVDDDVFDVDESLNETEADLVPPDVYYIIGDASEPLQHFNTTTYPTPAFVCLTVDQSGSWPEGGFFGALARRTLVPKNAYELSSTMEDLILGDCHLIPVFPNTANNSVTLSVRTFNDVLLIADNASQRLPVDINFCGLLVAQRHSRRSQSSGDPPELLLDALERSLRSLGKACRCLKQCSVHVPHLGHGSRSFQWYSVERLLWKHLVKRNRVPVYVYPFRMPYLYHPSTPYRPYLA